ncbi:hypothetical protein SAMN06272735_1822 [Streptomyces sp. TLI_55]|nr:hypothetical protein [Streptomyces sp. TLI_55]SNX57355.1 hypothetical protein SAMN06272735_1822 [Streptomyces sp. TLI_55]
MSSDTLPQAPAAPDIPEDAASLRIVPQRLLDQLIGTRKGTRSETAR